MNGRRQLFWNSHNERSTILSVLRMLLFMVFGVCCNIGGFYLATTSSAPLFLDTTGTAFVAMIFGPVHGAVVGIVGNYIVDLANAHEDYFAFSLVHVILALLWGALPRYSSGHHVVDIYNPDFTYKRLFITLLIIGALSGVLSIFASTGVSYLARPEWELRDHFLSHVRDDIFVIAWMKAIGENYTLSVLGAGALDVALFAAMTLFSIVDKMLSFLLAYGIVVALFPLCQYKPKSGQETYLHLGRATSTLMMLGGYLFVVMVLNFLNVSFDGGDPVAISIETAAWTREFALRMGAWIAPAVMLVMTFALALLPGVRLFAPKNDIKDEIYWRTNPHAEKVIPDMLQLIIVLLILFYGIGVTTSPVMSGPTDVDLNMDLFGGLRYVAVLGLIQIVMSVMIRFGSAERSGGSDSR